MRILGIDPGLATMGWGVIEADGYREKLVQYGALITYPRDTFPVRLRCIYKGVQELLKTFQPEEWIPILEQSIFLCWQGIFPLKEDAAQRREQPRKSDKAQELDDFYDMAANWARQGDGK